MPRSGLETAWAVIPAACSCATTSFQLELSANARWTRATVGRELAVGAASVMSFLRGGERAQRLPGLDDAGGQRARRAVAAGWCPDGSREAPLPVWRSG